MEQVDDLVNRNRKVSANFSIPAVKINIKSYPEFDGKLKNWKIFCVPSVHACAVRVSIPAHSSALSMPITNATPTTTSSSGS